MARLRGIPSSRLVPVPSRFGLATGQSEADRSRQRLATQAWRGWYVTDRWRRLSLEVRIEERFTCRLCGRVATGKGQSVCDHITPHRGDPTLFWSRDNLQCLCKTCHDSHKQSAERAQPW